MENTSYKHPTQDDVDEFWEWLLESGIEEQTLQVVTNINGYNWEALADIAYVMYGMRVNTIEDASEDW